MTLSRVRRIRDPRRRAEAAAELLRHREQETKAEIDTIRAVRDKAAREMLTIKDGDDWKYRPADVAKALSITRASVAQRFPHARDRS
jgi:hypothetical protein